MGASNSNPLSSLDPATLRLHRSDTVYRLAPSRLEDLLDPDPADPWPHHDQHSCASLTLHSHAYRPIRGSPDVRFLEDVALVDACRRADLPIRHSPQVRVRISARQHARSEVGLSWQLRQRGKRQDAGTALLVEDPDVCAARMQLRQRWRASVREAAPGTATTFGAL